MSQVRGSPREAAALSPPIITCSEADSCRWSLSLWANSMAIESSSRCRFARAAGVSGIGAVTSSDSANSRNDAHARTSKLPRSPYQDLVGCVEIGIAWILAVEVDLEVDRQVLLGGRARVASSVGRGLRKFEDRLVAVVGIGFQAAEDNVIERRRDSARAARRRPRRIDVKLLVLDPRLTTKRQHTGQELD